MSRNAEWGGVELVLWTLSLGVTQWSCENCPGDDPPPVHELTPGTYVVYRADGDPDLLESSIELTDSRLVLIYERSGSVRSVEYQVIKGD
jgi:hypothetical protein